MAERLALIEQTISQANRYIDVACKLRIWEFRGGQPRPTAECSQVYGGRYDKWTRQICGPAKDVVELGVTRGQFACITGDQRKKMALGARGGGKSHLMAAWAMVQVCKFPCGSVQLTSSTYDQARILWGRILHLLPSPWLRPGKDGIKRALRELHFENACVVRFKSASRPDSLRGQDNDAAGTDERQDCKQEAQDNIHLTLRKRVDYESLQCGTPKMGTDFHVEYLHFLEDAEAEVYRFPAPDNVFIPQGERSVYADAAKTMDERRYRAEVLAEFVSMEGMVYHAFSRFTHCREMPALEIDNTAWFAEERLRTPRDNFVGIDYALDPLCAVVCRVTKDGILYVIDEIVLRNEANIDVMAKQLRAKGYQSAWVCDACNNDRMGGKSSPAHLKRARFLVSHPRRPVHTMDVVNAVNTKLRTFDGEVGLYIDPKCRTLVQALEARTLTDGRVLPAKGFERITDALGCVVSRLWPTKHIATTPRLQLAA